VDPMGNVGYTLGPADCTRILMYTCKSIRICSGRPNFSHLHVWQCTQLLTGLTKNMSTTRIRLPHLPIVVARLFLHGERDVEDSGLYLTSPLSL
jgi:hypothetical protein